MVIQTLRRILAIARKELLVLMGTGQSRFMVLIPPVIQIFIFAWAATMEVKNVDAAVYESLQKEALPSQLTAANEMLDAYVTDIQGTPADPNAYHMQWDGSSGDLTLSQSQDGAYNVVFTIEGTVKDNLTSELGTQEIRVGKTHIVKTTTFELEGGRIISCERLADEGAEG